MPQYIIAIFGMLVLSFAFGLPLAWYLAPSPSDNERCYHRFVYLALTCGFSIIHLAFFAAMQLNHSGARNVTLPVLLLLAAHSAIFIIWKRKAILALCKLRPWTTAAFLAITLVASAHASLPVLSGKWEMAYGTGDDAARWYMVVNYFQDRPFEFMGVTDYSLRWPMRDRPLQNISGAAINSMFPLLTSAYAYTVSASMFAIMAAIAFCLVYESLFEIRRPGQRYALWAVAAVFFGFFGAMANILYTGRTTHYCSIYPVLACLGYAAVRDKGIRRGIWFAFWFVLLSYYYTNRYIAFSGFMLFAMITAQWLGGQTSMRTGLRNGGMLAVGAVVGLAATWDELVLIVNSILGPQGLFYLTLQRDSSYGTDGTLLDRFFKWSGLIGTYETHDGIPLYAMVIIGGGICFAIAVAMYCAIRRFRSSPGYTGLLLSNLLMALILFATERYFMAWKSALYWPSFVLLGFLACALSLAIAPGVIRKCMGIFFIACVLAYILLTSRQIGYYYQFADERHTKVDPAIRSLERVVGDYFANCTSCEEQVIYGHDLMAERHLLLREVFREYTWQPVRGGELYFEHDMHNRTELNYDNYDYDLLLDANTYKCGFEDLSGNARALLYEDHSFRLYTDKASIIEFLSGMVIEHYGGYDDSQRCLHYGIVLKDSEAKVAFANRGGHNWLTLEVRVSGWNGQNAPISVERPPGIRALVAPGGVDGDNASYTVRLEGLAHVDILRFSIRREAAEGPRIIVTNARWGY